jgi:hypothetical protein
MIHPWRKAVAVVFLGLSTVALGQNESVYAPPQPEPVGQGVNEGGVNLSLSVDYLTNYVYRGVDYDDVVDPVTREQGNMALNMYMEGLLQFDLGKRMPHPFLAISANLFPDDPVSQFQEFRPAAGTDLTLEPLTFTLGVQTYVYPQREDFDTTEGFGQVRYNDAKLWDSDDPVLSPYLFAAYDWRKNDGWYLEAGVSHDFNIRDWHLTLTPVARLAYTIGWQQQFAIVDGEGTGWQHWDLGLKARYSLNGLFNLSKRWGEWLLRGQVWYTQHLSNNTVGQTQTWGGLGIGFEY